ncbi:hypothetical protein LCGC14_2912430, partial [marine sediment metagenome]
ARVPYDVGQRRLAARPLDLGYQEGAAAGQLQRPGESGDGLAASVQRLQLLQGEGGDVSAGARRLVEREFSDDLKGERAGGGWALHDKGWPRERVE